MADPKSRGAPRKPSTTGKDSVPTEATTKSPVKAKAPVKAPVGRKTAAATPAASTTKVARPALDPELRARMVETAAYFRAERRGFKPGYDVEDWLAAETEIESLVGGPASPARTSADARRKGG